MSTRCQIGFYGNAKEVQLDKPEALIYRHSDGYPEGVLPDILPFLKIFNEVRGLADAEYASARTLQYLTNLADEHYEKFKQNFQSVIQEPNFSGYGICLHGFHGDIEYYYAIYPNRVDVYEVDFDEKLPIEKRFKKIKTEKI